MKNNNCHFLYGREHSTPSVNNTTLLHIHLTPRGKILLNKLKKKERDAIYSQQTRLKIKLKQLKDAAISSGEEEQKKIADITRRISTCKTSLKNRKPKISQIIAFQDKIRPQKIISSLTEDEFSSFINYRKTINHNAFKKALAIQSGIPPEHFILWVTPFIPLKPISMKELCLQFKKSKDELSQYFSLNQLQKRAIALSPNKLQLIICHLITLLQRYSAPYCQQTWLSFESASYLLSTTNRELRSAINMLVKNKWVTFSPEDSPFINLTETFWELDVEKEPEHIIEARRTAERFITEMALYHHSLHTAEQALRKRKSYLSQEHRDYITQYHHILSVRLHDMEKAVFK